MASYYLNSHLNIKKYVIQIYFKLKNLFYFVCNSDNSTYLVIFLYNYVDDIWKQIKFSLGSNTIKKIYTLLIWNYINLGKLHQNKWNTITYLKYNIMIRDTI